MRLEDWFGYVVFGHKSQGIVQNYSLVSSLNVWVNCRTNLNRDLRRGAGLWDEDRLLVPLETCCQK